MGGGNDAPLGGAGGRQNAEAVLLQFLGDGAHPVTGHGIGLDVTVHDQDGELEVFIHCGVPECDRLSLPIASG